MKIAFPHNAVFGTALAMLIGLAWFAYRHTVSLADADRWEHHTYVVIGETERLLSILKDTETGQRGFLITGEEKYLDPYRSALSRVSPAMASLKELTRDNPVQQKRLQELEPVIDGKLAELKHTIEVRRAEGFEPAQQIVVSNIGRSRMDEIRNRVGVLTAEEERLLQERGKKKAADTRVMLQTEAVAGLLAVSAFVLAFWHLRKEIVQRTRAEGQIRQQRDSLEERVAERTAALRQSQQLLQDVIDGSPSPIFLKDSDGRFLTINTSLEKMLGIARDELKGRTDYDIAPPEVADSWRTHDKQVLETGKAIQIEEVADLPDGHHIFLANKFPLVDENGQTYGVGAISHEITERKQAEERLRRNEEQLHALADSILNLAWWANGDGYITWYNRRWYEYTGTTPEQMEGWGWQSVHDPLALPAVMERWQASIATGEPFDMTFPLRGADGRFRSFLTRAQPLKDAQGRVVRWFGTNTDVEELKRSEEALQKAHDELENRVEERTAELRDSQQRFTSMLEGVRDYAIIFLTPDGRVATWNKGAEQIKGYQADEIVGQPFSRFYLPEDIAASKPHEELRTVMAEGRFEEENWRVRKDGSRYWASVVMTALRDTDGKVNGFVKIIRDLTARKQAEAALEESERAFRTLAESMPQMVWMCQPDGMNIYFNQRWVDYTGLTLEESYGRGWNTPFHPDDRQPAWNAWNHATATGDIYQIECRLRRADGSYHWFITRGVPFRDSEGSILKWFGTCTDIDDMKRAETEIRSYAADLQRSNRELEHFAYVASHDLQEPLRAVGSFSELLAKRYHGRLDDDADEFITFIVDGAKRMQLLINDLLAFSRAGTRGQPFTRVNSEEILQIARDNLDVAIAESGAIITHGPLPVLVADRGQLTQLLQNLLGNAIKFQRPGVAPRIHVCATHQNDAWQLSVRDNGIGILPEYFERIFILFQRLHGRDAYPGTGIGLAICMKIVERHGGRLWVESEPESGSTFLFTIPDNNPSS